MKTTMRLGVAAALLISGRLLQAATLGRVFIPSGRMG